MTPRYFNMPTDHMLNQKWEAYGTWEYLVEQQKIGKATQKQVDTARRVFERLFKKCHGNYPANSLIEGTYDL